jgi:chemotaxis protein MotB
MLRRRSHNTGADYWPGFVDALTVLLLAFTFLLTVFMLAQYFLAQELSGKDTALQKLSKQVVELTDLLSLERTAKKTLENDLSAFKSTLGQGSLGQAATDALSAKISSTPPIVPDQNVSPEALSQVDALNQQIMALRRQLAAIEEALNASQSKEKEAQTRINDLGSRLNVALAQKVQELAKYRSEFLGRLRDVIGERSDIRIVGDRFVFPSEVFFAPSQANLEVEGKTELDKIAAALSVLERDIPPDIPWVLRVDGHTDQRPIATPQFPSNWALSSARAIAVVQHLIAKGVAPQRLVAAGFGEFQPLDLGQSDEAFRRNRRIELKLTER